MRTCGSCGRENPDDVRFCGACGAPLGAVEGREVRKTVTILFADVTGSTSLGEKLDPEALRRVMGRYFDEMRSVLEAHGGTVEKFIGDAVMAVFGVPTLHEDDALRAVLAAQAMRERLAVLNGELEHDFGVAIEARIGVNTGEVVTGQGEPGQQRLATGDAVNVAARLEQAAAPGQILFGESTLELVRHAVEVEAVDPLPLKGKTERVPAFALVRTLEGAPSFDRRLDSPLVGRRDELETARREFDQAVSERRCRLVTVIGPPGIGKSRLAREVAEALQPEARVLVGRCLPYGEGITYWPLREIFTAAGSEDELDEALTAVTPDDVFWGVRKALERSARRQPLALVVEDIHWAEPTLLDLLEHVVDWARDAPLMLLCLARPELLDERPEWGQRAALIALEPLSGHESDELIEGLIGTAQLDEPTRTRIREVAEGNPLFVEQLLAMIAEGGDHERVPPTINALLAARLDALPVEERELIERAAVVGLDFEWEALGALSSDRRRPAGPQLSALVRKDLIRPHELLEDTFRFRHILIRDAAYERIPKQLRADLHERFADWLEPRSEEFGEIVAYHLEQAYRALAELGPTGPRAHELAARAAGHLIAAGSQATDGGDGHAAAGLFARAVSMLPIGDSSRLRALPAFGRALWEAGRIDDAESILSEAIEQGREAGARLIVIDASLTRTELRFSTLSERVERVSREEVVRELEQALPELRELGDDAALARALNLGGRLRFWRGDALVASKDFWQSSLMARRAGARAEEVASLQGLLGTLHQGPTPVAEGLKRIAEIRPRVGRNGSLTTTLLGTQGALLVMQGNFARARQLGAEADAVARDYGLGALHARHAGRLEGLIGILEGRPAIAQKPLQLACDDLERIGERGYLASLAPELAEALYLLGRDEEALDVTERWAAPKLTVPEDAHAQASWRLVRGKLLARRGDLLEGERMVRRGLEIAAGTDYLNLKGQAAADLADVLRLAGRSDEAAEATRQAIGFYQEKGNAAAARLLAAEAVVP